MPEKPDLYRMLAVAGYQAYRNTLVGNQAPAVRRYLERAHDPQSGDLVVETSTIAMPNWDTAALGWLIEKTYEPMVTKAEHDAMLAEGDYWKTPEESYDAVPTEPIFYVDPLDPDQPSPYRWHNADFVAIPTEALGFSTQPESTDKRCQQRS